MQRHPDEKGLIHCHSYGIQERLADRLRDFGAGERIRVHSRENRDAELESWKACDDPEVFLSVKMEEALDLEGDLCRWQVLCKAPFLNTGDSRVEHRLENGQWAWYYRAALRTIIQACGRVIRAPDDYGTTYLADTSLLDLFERSRTDMPPWFAEQVDRLSKPDLPAFDPRAALGGMSGDTTRASRRRQTWRTSENDGGNAGESDSSGRSRRRSRSRRSPMADVWDTDG
jgi:hypothetical protein